MQLGKSLTVAQAEFAALVRTKAFIVTMVLMPVMLVGSIVIQRVLAKQIDTTPRTLAVIDRSGVFYDDLARLAAGRNAMLGEGMGARYDLERVDPAGKADDELLFALSERVRKNEIYAFAEIPANALDADGGARVRYYSDNPTYRDLLQWLGTSVDELARNRRLKGAGLDPKVVAKLNAKLESDHLRLLARDAAGKIVPAEPVDPIRTYVVPLGLMYLLFLIIFTTVPQSLTAVVEEKMSRVSEVLLGSVTPFELMLGKLLGSTGATMVLATVYLAGAMTAAERYGVASALTPELLVAFVVFLLLAVLLFGSIMIAIGSACTGLKDAQSLMTPVMLICVLPLFAVQGVLQSPNSSFSVAASMFPLGTPFLMLLRLAIHPGPPVWQVVLGFLGCAAFTLLVVAGAGRIFRVGLLVQGKSATFGQMLRWATMR